MAEVILICGKVCSGKTTYAEKLIEEHPAILLSVDELMNTFFDACIGEKRMEFEERAKKYLLKKSLELVKNGNDVILDWGFWMREERERTRKFYGDQGIVTRLHCILVDEEQWRKRRTKRNAQIEAGEIRAFYVDEERAAKFGGMFEAPEQAEVDVYVS